LAEVYWLLARVQLAQGELGQAMEYVVRALDIATEADNQEGQGIACRIQGQIFAQMDKLDQALESLQTSVELLQKTESQMELGKSHYELGVLLSQMPDRRDERIEHLQRAIDLFATLGATREEQQAHQALANDCSA
jgi:tetratricopeptide (TPR) repeat protein